MKRTALLFLLIGVLSINAQAPFVGEDKLFYDGKELLSEKNYIGAIEKLNKYKHSSTNEDLTQEADYLIGVASFEKKEHNTFELLSSYLTKYPAGRHSLSVKFMQASCLFFDNSYNAAVELFKQIDPDRLSAYEQEDYYLRFAICLLKTGKLEEAEQTFAAVSQVSRRHNQTARYYLAYIAYTEEEYKKALPIFKEVRNNPEFSQTAPYYITQINYALRNYDQVIAEGEPLLRSTSRGENHSELTRIIGESYFYTGDTDKASSMLASYIKEVDKPVRDGRYVYGVLLFEQRNYAKAIDQFILSTAANDDMTQSAYLYLGQCYLNSGDKKSARRAFESAMKSGSDNEIRETAMYNYAMLIYETSFSLFDESVTIFENFINEYPRSRYSDKVNDCLVEVYMTTKSYNAALASIMKIKQPSDKVLKAKQRILFQLGTQAVANADFNGAIAHLNNSITLGRYDRETEAEAHFWRAESLYRSNLYFQAVKDFNTFLSTTTSKQKPIYQLALYGLGYTYFKMQEFGNAMRYFNQYIQTGADATSPMYADVLNRLGDCYFDSRDFTTAESFYSRAASAQPSAADYSLFQKGFVLGLKKDYQGKIDAMERLIVEMPNSGYVDDAMFEKGRTYVLLGQFDLAEQTYKQLLSRFPQGEPSRKGSVQLGLLYFNTNRLEEAISAYKHVVSTYSGSEEAATAVQDLKSVYIEKNDIDSYAQYIKTIDTNVKFEASEHDQLSFLSAEKLYLKGDLNAAERSLNNYIQNFAQGAYTLGANYYLGSIYFERKDYPRAATAFDHVILVPQNKYAEDALARRSEIAYLDSEYATALPLFKQLNETASKPENKRAARLGALRCAYRLNDAADALTMSSLLIDESNLSPEVRQEALFVRAKMLIQSGEAQNANDNLTELSKDPRNIFGAEANYLLAQNYFDADQTKKAESTILAFMDKGTPHQYWMARAFLLLADLYIKTGKPLDAKQYLLSLQSNYTAQDEIAAEIEKRLKTIQ